MNTYAQVPEWTKAVVFLGGSIVCEAVADGLYDNGNKVPAHFLGAASTGLLVTYPVIMKRENKEPIWAVPAYICFRIALFDPIYNKTRSLPLGYIGNTSTWDRMRRKIDPGDGMILGRMVILSVGVRLTFEL